MNNVLMTPRPTRSILRNRRIVLDLKASVNGSLVGENGLKGAARQESKFAAANDRRELTIKAVGAGILFLLGLVLISVL
ncbi:hypothetical protein CEQ90_06350 [Lewinellaceae bacterium SD302]|nr:hypothetical protein CEQ90_06350 [Lewinellaceae bacterium SD302]